MSVTRSDLFATCLLIALSVGATLAAAGCGGTEVDDQSSPSLVRVEEEPAGENCPAGGQKISTGPDTSGDGTLDESEIAGTSYFCDGEDGESGEEGSAGADGNDALVRLEEEPAGDNCPNGGTAVHSGIDDNDDGSLDEDEVSQTRYVCDGRDGRSVLVIEEPIAPGDGCARGGKKIEWGIDENGNGKLEEGEVDVSRSECKNRCSSNTVWNAISESCVSATRLSSEGKVDSVDVDDSLLPSSISKGDDCQVYAVFDSSTSPDSTSGNERADYTFSQPAGLWVVAGSKTFKSKRGQSIYASVFNDITSLSYDRFKIFSDSNAKTDGKAIDSIELGFSDDNGGVLSGTDIPTSVQDLSRFPAKSISVDTKKNRDSKSPLTDEIECSIDSLGKQP